MSLQVIEILIKIIGLLNNKETLSSSAKRKRIGANLLDIHQTISRISANANRLQGHFHYLVGQFDKYGDIPGRKPLNPDYLTNLIDDDLLIALLIEQRTELTHP
ncbi:MAG: hypothetical protein OES46_19380 [Gammaproteobacteria bacterium]|nr:hypothetical protein [Gammaproteobacteria bacterium]